MLENVVLYFRYLFVHFRFCLFVMFELISPPRCELFAVLSTGSTIVDLMS